jgi:23S rRNA pseudouridine1911/1915/1917 synthase
VLRRFDRPVATTLLECRLETGRTHQIRVHLSAIDHPVAGDGDYGGRRDPFVLRRPFLHAAHLALDHPVTGDPLAFDSPLPADLAAVLDGLS